MSVPITMFDAAGSSRFAVTGAGKALDFGLGPVQAIILGTITRVGGGTLRDVLIRRVPVVLNSEFYVIPTLVAAAVIVVCESLDMPTQPSAVGAAALCFAIRMTGVRYGLNAPGPRGFDAPTPTRLNGGTGWFAAVGAAAGAGKTVAVVVDGAVGVLGILAATELGAERLIAMSRCADRHALARQFGATGIVEERGEAGVVRIEELADEFAAGTAEAWGAPRTSKGVPVLSMSSHREPGRSHDRMVH